MKERVFLCLIIVGFLMSLISAEIILNEQPKEVYNLGDTINIPVKIKSSTDITGSFQMNLLCGGAEMNFYKNGISLVAGEEKNIDSSIPLIQEVIENSRGICKIKAMLSNGEYILTDDFRISELIEVKASTDKIKYNPGEEIVIQGNATKESGEESDGFLDLTFSQGNYTAISQTETISNGAFYSKVKTPETMKAGDYLMRLTAYEKDSQSRTTNRGEEVYAITINQIPTSLEILFEQEEVAPGETLKTKAVLRDQTGEKISSIAVITIKDQSNTILEQVEKQTDSYFEYSIKNGELPKKLTVVAVSNQLTSESSFNIKEQEKVDIEIINKTVVLTNTGNVFYNETILVKIGEEPLNINAVLEIGETKRYSLTAPAGEYSVKVVSPEGSEISRNVVLTGEAVSIKEVSENAIELMRHPFAWIFITIILGGVAFLFFKKGYRKSFFGYINSRRHKIIQKEEGIQSQRNLLVSPRSKADLSLSIKGTQQKSSAVCIKIKNYSELASKKGNARETLQKITDMAESAKASTYENNECLFFIFSPLITKTFENERTAVELAQSAKKTLDDHNRLFKQKINYGISTEHGEIIAKQSGDSLIFTGLGAYILNLRKLASLSQGEVFVGEKMKEKIHSDAKLEKHSGEKMSYYTIKELRDKEKHQRFLNSFMNRQEKENKKLAEKQKKDSQDESLI